MTLRPLFYSDQDCRDRLKPGKPMFFNVYRSRDGLYAGVGMSERREANHAAYNHGSREVPPYRIVVKAKPTPSPEESPA